MRKGTERWLRESLREKPRLVFQRHNRAAITAERGDFLQVTGSGGNRHYRAVAINGVAGGSEVPASAFGMLGQMRDGLAWRLRQRRLGRRQT